MDLTDEETKIYFLKTSKKDTITIGHGMCSGGFSFKPNHLYQARFSIMDNCNSYQDEWTDWIEFESPYQSYQDKLKENQKKLNKKYQTHRNTNLDFKKTSYSFFVSSCLKTLQIFHNLYL